MKKQEFIFVFPMSGDTTTKTLNPLAVKETAIRYLKVQSEIRGNICIVQDAHNEVLAMAYFTEAKGIVFFTEDNSINDIVPDLEEVFAVEGGARK